MTRIAPVATWFALAAISPVGLLASTADLPVTPGRGVQLVWTTGEWATCAPYQFDAFPSAMEFWNVEGPNEYCYETEPYDDAPVLTAVGHMAIIDGARFLAMDTHGTGDDKGWYSAEYYLTPDSAAARLLDYYDSGFDSTLIRLGMTSAGHARAERFLRFRRVVRRRSRFARDRRPRVVLLERDVRRVRHPGRYDRSWRTEATSPCRGSAGISRTVGGDSRAATHRYTSQANSANDLPEAELITATGSYDEESNSINLEYDCENWAARLLEWGVDHGGGILFLTNYERNSDLFEVYGYARGGTTRSRHSPSRRRRERPHPRLSHRRPSRFRQLSDRRDRFHPHVAHPQRAKTPRRFGPRARRTGGLRGEETDAAGAGTGLVRKDPARRPEGGPPLRGRCRLLPGPGRGQLLSRTRFAGRAWRRSSTWGTVRRRTSAPPIPGRTTPTSHGTASWAKRDIPSGRGRNSTSSGKLRTVPYRPTGGPMIRSARAASRRGTGDFDYTDVDEDGRPNGPVARLFASTREEVERYVHFSNRYDGGGGGRVLLCEGDLTAATGSTYVAPGRWLDRVEAVLSRRNGIDHSLPAE